MYIVCLLPVIYHTSVFHLTVRRVANNSQRQHQIQPAHSNLLRRICKAFWLRLCHLRRQHMNQRNKTRQIFSSDLQRNVHKANGAGELVRHAAQQFLLRFRGRAHHPSSTVWLLCACMPAPPSHVSRKINKKKYIYMENKYWNGKRLKISVFCVFDGSTSKTKKKLRENQNIHKYFFFDCRLHTRRMDGWIGLWCRVRANRVCVWRFSGFDRENRFTPCLCSVSHPAEKYQIDRIMHSRRS